MREEEKKRSSQNSSFKRFLKKRWAFPAIYIAAAAIILTGVLWYQNAFNNAADTDNVDYNATDIPGKKYNEPAVEVNRSMENILSPVKNAEAAEVKRDFYNMNGKSEEQEAALVFYNNQYHPNTGIDYGMKDGETFDVVASLSGTVTKVDEDVLLGNVIVIEHDNGIETLYQSVKDISVEVGDEVKQGNVIAKAGESIFDEETGVHVHFEIRKDGQAVNPNDFFQKPLSSLQEFKQADDTKATKEKKVEEDKTSEDKSDKDSSNDEEKDSEDKSNNDTEENSKESSKESSNA
ncbi:M23 family metallopeptidase [Cytobacillus depressus]|uniref:M23 family metallopeptidase n=1 Tax=Cytobacillus depressus TaxID=1602942 RepID=A0A6L3V849_9BACI|nr:M23 family metallopeptidase [Cytobacillus depressus]KAB2336535.1 M23 family metallopeptidase [Cytobacillus depressus]